MINVDFPSFDDYKDVSMQNKYQTMTAAGIPEEAIRAELCPLSRDNARTPYQWDSSENAGFTTGTPWLPVNENHSVINAAAAMGEADSTFHYYQKLIALRKEYDVFREGWFELMDPESETVFAYTRDTDTAHMLVVCNFSSESQDWKLPWNYHGAKKLIGNYPDEHNILRPYEAYIYYYEDVKE